MECPGEYILTRDKSKTARGQMSSQSFQREYLLL
jgi:hypothetical protein